MNIDFPQQIREFIAEHHVLTLATCIEQVPWCANCFYVFDEQTNSFVFSSDITTRHAQEALVNAEVAGSIVLETETIGKIQGLQFGGTMRLCDETYKKNAKKRYLQRFPYAVLKKTTLWQLQLHYAKLTDNRLGFGTKLIWEK